MLAYRHGFHAGGPADVLKHSVLIFCLDYLAQKGKPCLLVDTHAGAGSYPLGGGFAAKNREWEGGIGRIAAAARQGPVPPMQARYLEFAGAALPGEKAAAPYPGSPAIMARFLRSADRLVCFELQGGDFDSLSLLLASCPRAEARREDGFGGLPGLLPPPSRRGCVFIDPSYEIKEDFAVLPKVLRGALKRFPGGLYIIWYPLLAGNVPLKAAASGQFPPADFAGELLGLYRGNRCRIELHVSGKDRPPANSPRGMYGSGLVIYNPPWTLRAALEDSLPFLASVLGTEGRWDLQWEAGG